MGNGCEPITDRDTILDSISELADEYQQEVNFKSYPWSKESKIAEERALRQVMEDNYVGIPYKLFKEYVMEELSDRSYR